MPALAVFWNGLPNWIKQTIAIGGAILLTILLGKAYVEAKKSEAVRRARERDAAKTADTVHKIEKEATTDANRAIAAGDSLPPVSQPDELPDDVAAVIFRGHQTSGPDR